MCGRALLTCFSSVGKLKKRFLCGFAHINCQLNLMQTLKRKIKDPILPRVQSNWGARSSRGFYDWLAFLLNFKMKLFLYLYLTLS